MWGLEGLSGQKKDLIRVVTSVIFGDPLGLVEATIGYILHLVRLRVTAVTSFFLSHGLLLYEPGSQGNSQEGTYNLYGCAGGMYKTPGFLFPDMIL